MYSLKMFLLNLFKKVVKMQKTLYQVIIRYTKSTSSNPKWKGQLLTYCKIYAIDIKLSYSNVFLHKLKKALKSNIQSDFQTSCFFIVKRSIVIYPIPSCVNLFNLTRPGMLDVSTTGGRGLVEPTSIKFDPLMLR